MRNSALPHASCHEWVSASLKPRRQSRVTMYWYHGPKYICLLWFIFSMYLPEMESQQKPLIWGNEAQRGIFPVWPRWLILFLLSTVTSGYFEVGWLDLTWGRGCDLPCLITDPWKVLGPLARLPTWPCGMFPHSSIPTQSHHSPLLT